MMNMPNTIPAHVQLFVSTVLERFSSAAQAMGYGVSIDTNRKGGVPVFSLEAHLTPFHEFTFFVVPVIPTDRVENVRFNVRGCLYDKSYRTPESFSHEFALYSFNELKESKVIADTLVKCLLDDNAAGRGLTP